jgi:hypothetical protein
MHIYVDRYIDIYHGDCRRVGKVLFKDSRGTSVVNMAKCHGRKYPERHKQEKKGSHRDEKNRAKAIL